MRRDVEHALREMIKRDYNHPSIFSWVPFNETWGCITGKDRRRRSRCTGRRRRSGSSRVVRLARELDPTRLVEDNSVCCGVGHTETDINSWHAYLPGWEWNEHLREISENTYPGSQWNFEPGWVQGRQPNINSEFGNVWGYEGSTGDVDYTWDYHRAVDAFRRHPKIAGWLYTEHHDVVNEWNGYWRYDRSDKVTGLDELVEGMSLRDLHAPLYIAVGHELSYSASPGQTLQVPLFASFLTGARRTARRSSCRRSCTAGTVAASVRPTARQPPHSVHAVDGNPLEPQSVQMPNEPAVAVLAVRLEDTAARCSSATSRRSSWRAARRAGRARAARPSAWSPIDPASFSSRRGR
jgi:hypothetical protein